MMLDGSYVFLRRLPILGTIAKLQRFEKIPGKKETIEFLRMHHVRTFAPEPAESVSQTSYKSWIRAIGPYTKISSSPFLPTKTFLIDLRQTEDEIFQRFSEAKRRAVRKAQKQGVEVRESTDIQTILDVKKRSAGFLGFIVVTTIPQLWKVFEKHATILLAHHPSSPRPVGGILLLFWNKRALYWLVGATKLGKRYAAPTLLVWEALRVSKNRGCTKFDFLGVNDERLPKDNPSWRGFTKFKEGFGGKPLYYPMG
jgi:lipid II:glycine glycyltransferase (peptidoglycan interpeptide bridge formation enzyme)